jgi:purine-nucleoside phosphorylase
VIDLKRQIQEAVDTVRMVSEDHPEIGVVLGTGLGALAGKLDVTARIPYENIPHFPVSTVDTHAGDLVLGRLGKKRVLALSGRFHYYEGYSMQEVAFPIRVAKALGISTLIVSNAAGGMNPQFACGDLMVITDHVNLMGDNPLIGVNDDTLGPRFPDMCEPYTRALVALAEEAALELGYRLQRGVYVAVAGPCLETRAEYRFLRLIGGDAVGMSTVPEVIAAVHAGLKVLGFSAITDECFPDALQPASIEKIIATAEAVEPRLTEIVMRCIERIS